MTTTPVPPPTITAAELERLISAQRFASFRQAAARPEAAVALYTWNARVAGAFAELLHHVEVLVRNAMHHQMTNLHAQVPGRPHHKAWFDEPKWSKHHWFNKGAQEQITKATKRAGHTPAHPNPGKVIAALNFGFWRYLARERYEQSFWIPALDSAFAAPGAHPAARRRAVEQRLAFLHTLRNRPAVSNTLDQLYTDAIELVSFVSPTAADWLEHETRHLPQLLHNRPGIPSPASATKK